MSIRLFLIEQSYSSSKTAAPASGNTRDQNLGGVLIAHVQVCTLFQRHPADGLGFSHRQ